MSQQYHYVAVDLGAESGRVMLASLSEEKLSLQEMHRFANGPVEEDGTLRWDVDRLFVAIKKGIKKALALEDKIQSIGVDTWGVDFGLIDSNGQLVEKPYHYRDARTIGVLEQASETLSKRDIYQNTGIQFLPFNTLFQLIAYGQQKPEVLKKASSLLFMPNLFMYLLCGDISSEYTIASTSQLMDMKTGTWSDVILNAFRIPRDILPKITSPGTEVAVLDARIADELDCSRIPVIAVGTHDTASAVVGIPADHDRNWAYLSSGTWSIMGAEISEPIINEKTLEYDFTNEGGIDNTIRLLKNIMGLWLVQECRRYWAGKGDKFDYDQLTQMASEAKPFDAYLNPDYQDFITPGDMPERINRYLKLTGQSQIHDKGQMVRVILEALAARYRQNLEHLESISGSHIDVLHIVGGGSRNELLNQLTADAIGRPVVSGPVEATVLGNVLVQAKAGGQIESLKQAKKIIAKSFPLKEYEPQEAEKWDDFMTRFTQHQVMIVPD